MCPLNSPILSSKSIPCIQLGCRTAWNARLILLNRRRCLLIVTFAAIITLIMMVILVYNRICQRVVVMKSGRVLLSLGAYGCWPWQRSLLTLVIVRRLSIYQLMMMLIIMALLRGLQWGRERSMVVRHRDWSRCWRRWQRLLSIGKC